MGTETRTYKGSGKDNNESSAVGGNESSGSSGTAGTRTDRSATLQSLIDRRRCRRLSLSFPIEVSGADVTGRPFADRTVTNDVSEEGCRFDLLRGLRCGDVVTIRVVGRDNADTSYGRALRFEIMWVETCNNGWAIGAAKLEPENIWHMSFPKQKNAATSSR